MAEAKKVTGEVMHRKSGADEASPLKFGTPLDDGDWISTSGAASKTCYWTEFIKMVAVPEDAYKALPLVTDLWGKILKWNMNRFSTN